MSAVAEQIPVPVDIIWVVDSSASMLDEQARITQNLQGFANRISQAGIDHRVVILTNRDLAAGTALAGDPNRYLFLRSLVGSNDAWLHVLAQFPNYQAFLRADASTHVIVVSDDNSFMRAAAFKAEMEGLLGKPFIQHAIASEIAGGGLALLSACLGAFAPGIEYYELAETTGGEAISICTADWSLVFEPLERAVIESAPLPCSYPIPPPPPGEQLDPDLVNVDYANDTAQTRIGRVEQSTACGDAPAWHYDNNDDPAAVQLCPSSCMEVNQGGTLTIVFGCETVRLE